MSGARKRNIWQPWSFCLDVKKSYHIWKVGNKIKRVAEKNKKNGRIRHKNNRRLIPYNNEEKAYFHYSLLSISVVLLSEGLLGIVLLSEGLLGYLWNGVGILASQCPGIGLTLLA